MLESYTYLGLNTVVERDHQQDGINLTTTLDTFGRIQTENWGTTTSTTPVDGYSYGYDNDGNVLYACNSANATFSQLYTYDQFNQVTTFKRGTLATGNQSMATPNTLSFNSESWSSNPLGDSKKITCPEPNSGRIRCRINAVWIFPFQRCFCRIVENFGEE